MSHRLLTTFLGWGLLATCALISLIAGCGRQEQVSRYQVPKTRSDTVREQTPSGPPAGSATAAPHGPTGGRMLGAIVLHNGQAWFFKAVGGDEALGEHKDAFRALVESVRFSDDKPAWDLPEDWQQEPGSGMRYATIKFGPEDDPLDLSVIPMGIPDGDEAKCILMNVNRWRGQVGLGPLTEDEIGEQTQSIPLEGLTAVLVDLKGGAPPSSSMGSGPSSGSSAAGPAKPPAAGTPSSATSSEPAVGFDIPDGWTEGEKIVSRGGITIRHEAAFNVSDGEDLLEISLDRMPAGGSLRQNATRWQAQIGLTPGNPADLAESVETMTIGGRTAEYVELVGPEQSIFGVVVAGPNESWYIKLKGANDLADRQRQAYKDFLQSIRFR